MPQTNDVGGTINLSTTTTKKALSFTLPSGSNYSLDNVILRLGEYQTPGIEPVLQIRNDVGGSDPGSTVLASFNTPAPQGTGIFSYTFTPSSAFTFNAETKYWLYLGGNAATTTIDWRASAPGIPPTGIATFNNNRLTSNGGSSWSNSSIINSFEINVTEVTQTVPEPATVLGLMVFGAGLMASKRKKED